MPSKLAAESRSSSGGSANLFFSRSASPFRLVPQPSRILATPEFQADQRLSPIVAYYKEQLKENNFHVTSALIMPARKTWSCGFDLNGRPGSIMLYPSEQNKSRMTIALMYELPTIRNDSLLEPREDFDVVGPGEIFEPSPNRLKEQ